MKDKNSVPCDGNDVDPAEATAVNGCFYFIYCPTEAIAFNGRSNRSNKRTMDDLFISTEATAFDEKGK